MPMSSSQLAALVDRARQKPPPVVVSLPVQPQKAAPARPAPSTARPLPAAPVESAPKQRAAVPSMPAAPVVSPTSPSSAPQPEHTTEPEDFPVGWVLRKESWYFHRRFYRVFRRPMAHGEYSHLLWQIRRRRAEHLWEDCWRVTLPDGRRTLAVRGTPWRLITILPKDWQPPTPIEVHVAIETSAA